MRRKNGMRNKKGITLIALVITIIVLLILAGVSLSLVMGNEGILEKVTNAVEKSKKATAEERIKIAVAGSFDREGKMNIDDLSENLKNVEKINETDLPIVKLPATVNVDGYTFIIEEKGTVELSGPKPIVSEVNITLKDGSIVPEDGVDDGTELKVTFTATMEKGEITSISPQLPYVTNGTEKEVNFTITGLVDGITSETEKTIDLRDYYKKTEFEVGDIIKKPSKFYGAIVDNYEVNASATDTVKNVVTTWRIFYAGKEPNGTENNIYLIADDYIEYTQAPNGKNGSTLVPKDTKYRIAFVNIYNDYNGGKFIYENSLAQNWLSGYLNYTTNENNVETLSTYRMLYLFWV